MAEVWKASEHEFDFTVCGISHHQAELAVLEKASFDKNRCELGLRDLYHREGVAAGLIVSTCNRVEVYALGRQPHLSENCKQFFLRWSGSDKATIQPLFYTKHGLEAIRHLFSVAASIDSMLPGEAQVLGQVKSAYLHIVEGGRSHPLLDRIMRKTFSVAKKVRTETQIAIHPVSIATVAVEMAQKIFGELKESRVLLLGAGKMSELAAVHLLGRNIAELIVCNRSYEKAVGLAKRFSATAIPVKLLDEYLRGVDVVLVSTGANDFVIQNHQLRQIMPLRKNKPMFFIDISVPRNVDPKINKIENVYLYDIDDLKSVATNNLESRKSEIKVAQDIIDHEVEVLSKTLRRHRFDHTIGELQRSFEGAVAYELELLFRNGLKLPENICSQLRQQLPRGLSSRLVFKPAGFLKDKARTEDVGILRAAFGLDLKDKKDEVKRDCHDHELDPHWHEKK